VGLDERIQELAQAYREDAAALLREVVRIPADYVDRPESEGGDPRCGLSNHEGPRLELLKRRIVELGAVASADDVGFDGFGNLVWSVTDLADGVPPEERTVVYLDGHSDTVQALRSSWAPRVGAGLDAYDGLTDPERIDRDALRRELGYLPPDGEWDHLVWGRGTADQLGGVVCQVMATRILHALRGEGSLRGVTVWSYATVCEEDNDGAGPAYLMRDVLPAAGAARVPDAVLLTEGTGCARAGALGIYRGQRGRMQIELTVTGRSCHGSMPHEGLNPLEHGGAILQEAAAAHERGEGFLDHAFLGRGTRTASDCALETPSDCAVPERFRVRFDRRLTVGETPEQAVRDLEVLPAVARARAAGLTVELSVPTYDKPSWRGVRLHNPQIYAGWITPEEHPAIQAALDGYRRVVGPIVDDGEGGATRREPRLARWVFSTDGVGFPLPIDDERVSVPARKRWVTSGAFKHPAMLGLGPGIEHNTHKIGECVDARELAPTAAFYARFPTLLRERAG